jgi:predicted Zn-dependent peptidase
MLNRTIAPPIKDAVDFNIALKPCTHATLKNGVKMYYLNDGAEEVSQVEFVFSAGNYYENKNGVASIANYLIKNGTTKKSAFEITDYFEYYGAYLNFSCYNEFATITLHCLSKYMKELLPVIRELITEATFPENELEIYQQNKIQALAVNLLKCDFVADRLINENLYGANHPYGRIISKDDIKAINRVDLQQFYHQYYLNAQCLIFSAGKLPADFEELMDRNFGDLQLNETILLNIQEKEMNSQRKQQVINDVNGVQGAIRIARPFPTRHHPDFQKANVLNVLFGGYFGSRLMANIREEKGYTYGISSYFENLIQYNAWMISTEAGKDVTEQTIVEVYKEMKLLREEKVEDDELSLVKNYMIGLNLGYIDGPFQIIARWKSLILNGLDENYFYSSLNIIKNIQSDEIQSLANKYLMPEDFFELVVI